MNRHTLILFFLFYTVFGVSGEDVDWRKIATETDEPSYGLEITSVTAGSQAEKLGLVAGDYLVQVGHQLVREFGLRRSGGDDRIFFVRKGGKEEEAIVKSGLIGVYFRESFRPWLGYLRGEIGVSNPKWDDPVVKALVLMRSKPGEAIKEWEKAEAAGYQKDELTAFFRAYTQWRQGENAPVQEAFDAVLKEYKVIPFVYFVGLEDMALAYNEVGILRALRELDSESLTVRESDIEKWEKALDSKGAASPIDLATIEKRHEKNVTAELGLGEKAGTKNLVSPDLLIKKRPHGSSLGHYKLSHLEHPDKINRLHLRMKYRMVSFGNHSGFISAARFRLYSKTKEDKTRRIVEIRMEAPKNGSSYLTFYATESSTARRILLPDISIPRLKGEKENFGSSIEDIPKDVSKLSELITIDMVADEKTTAVFFNGIPFSNLPHSEELENLALSFHVCGVAVVPEAFDVWTLK